MNASILLGLAGRARIAELLFPLTAVTVGVFTIIWFARWLVLPIDDPAFTHAFTAGVGAFLVAGLCSAVTGCRMYQLRTCPFATNLPGLERRVLCEYRTFGGALIAIAAIIGPIAIASPEGDARAVSPLFLPLMAALGFGSGLLNNDPPERGGWLWRIVPWLFIPALFFSVELAQFTSRGAWAWLVAACGVMLLAIEATGTAQTRRTRSAARPRASLTMGDEWAGTYGTGHGSWHSSTTTEGRRRSTKSMASSSASEPGARHATLRTDWEWARAHLHEIYGVNRSGWFGTTAFFTVMLLALGAGVLVAHGALSTKGSADGESLRSALLGLDALRGPLDLRQSILVTAFTASVISVFILGTPIASPLSPLHPLSRVRRARVVWLVTQAQEWTIFGVAFVTLALASIAFSLFTDAALVHLWRQGAPVVTAILIVMPLARWGRLRMIDGRGHQVIWHELATVGQVVAAAAVMLPQVLGSVLLMLLWITARAWPAPIGAIVAVGSIAVCFGVRWWWFEALRRHFARCDL